MPGRELPAIQTPATAEQVQSSFIDAWRIVFGYTPNDRQCRVLMAQTALETGRWQHMVAYSIGGVKCGAEVDHAYYATRERLSRPIAEAYLRQSRPDAPVERASDNPDGTVTIRLLPRHHGCRFRAFTSLAEACRFHLQKLAVRWPRALDACVDGDPGVFVDELHRGGYFTGNIETYHKSVRLLFTEYQRFPWPFDTQDVPLCM